MKLLKPIILLSVVTLFVYSCKKTDDNTNNNNNNGGSTKTKLELLTQKNWKVSSLVSSGTDLWGTFLVEACNKDNQYRFRTDDSLSLYDMASKCSPSDPDSSVSIYKFYNNNTQLILNVKLTSTNTLNDTADIVELSETLLKINAEYSSVPATISFIHP
jgi:hypothetical protein